MRQEPAASNGALPADLSWLLGSYYSFGLPYSAGPMVGFVDRRAELYAPRQAWMDRSLPPDIPREAVEDVFADLDAYHLEIAQKEMEAASKG